MADDDITLTPDELTAEHVDSIVQIDDDNEQLDRFGRVIGLLTEVRHARNPVGGRVETAVVVEVVGQTVVFDLSPEAQVTVFRAEEEPI